MFASASCSYDDSYESGDPRVSFIPMQYFESTKANEQCEQRNDDNANSGTDRCPACYSRQGHATNDRIDDAESSERRQVHQNEYRDKVLALERVSVCV